MLFADAINIVVLMCITCTLIPTHHAQPITYAVAFTQIPLERVRPIAEAVALALIVLEQAARAQRNFTVQLCVLCT